MNFMVKVKFVVVLVLQSVGFCRLLCVLQCLDIRRSCNNLLEMGAVSSSAEVLFGCEILKWYIF